MDDRSVRKLQLLELKILLELKRICEKHDISYFLIDGTLLGAVRHQGFIPWDDDIDIGMMRADYNRFLNVCKDELSHEFFLQTYDSDCTYANLFAKIRLNGTEFLEPINMDVLFHKGIFIDIFPFDFISNRKYVRKLHKLSLVELSTICWIKNDYAINFSTPNLKLLRLLSRLFSKTQVLKMTECIFNIYNNRKTNYYINSSLNCYPSELFDEYVELDFEGIKFPVPLGHAKYLECTYGVNYMCLPPANKRVIHSPYPPDFGKYSDIDVLEDVLGQMSNMNASGDTICRQ